MKIIMNDNAKEAFRYIAMAIVFGIMMIGIILKG